VKSGRSPNPYQNPIPKEEKKDLDSRPLLYFPGDDHWSWQWEAEREEQWKDRQERGFLGWYRYIDSIKNSRNGAVKAKVSFYLVMVKEGRPPIPIEDPEESECRAKKLASHQAEQDWMDAMRAEILQLMPVWRADRARLRDNPPLPYPAGLQDWQKKWWRECWEEGYRQFREEDDIRIAKLGEMKNARRMAEEIQIQELEMSRLKSMRLDLLYKE
jgi:hypothetical protein